MHITNREEVLMEIQRVIDVERETWIHACKEVNTHTKKDRKT